MSVRSIRNFLVGLSVAAIFVPTAPASAAEMPYFDPAKWCRAVASSGPSYSAMIYGGCMDQEQTSYDAVKRVWAALPGRQQAWCSQVAASGSAGSYMILQGCLDQEMAAESGNQNRTFRR